MRKFFSFFAALLFAGSMMAEEATMTAGTNGSACTVNDVAGIKCGTSSKAGDMTITVGAGATKLSFYAAAWNGVSGLSLNLAADGVTFSPASVSLTADAGISNNTPFTLSGLPEDFKFEVELTGVTAETTIAVTSSAAKRFVVWGASYEAGEAPAVATPVISGDETFTESVIVTITCSTPEADIYYTTDGTTDPKCDCPAAPEYTQQIVLTETTTIMAAAYTGNAWSAVATKTFTKVEPLPEPTDCATAAAAALSVSANNELYNDGAVYTIQGYVTSIKTAYSDQYHNISFWMADTQEGGEVLQAYRAACETEEDAPQVGDKVAVTGSLTKYGTTPEFAQGCTYVIMDAPVVDNIWTVAGSPSVFGSEWSASDANNDMVKQEDGTYKFEKENLLLEAGNVEFKVVKDHSWAEGYPEQNYQLNIAEAAIYTITIIFNEETKAITANALKTGDAPVVDEWAKIIFTEAAAADDIAEDAVYTAQDSEFALTLHDSGNKMVIDGNDCRFGTAESYTMYNFRIKSGGASGSDKNYFTLNIPEAGTLRIAPRTGSNSATDRALIVIQGEDTLYNQIVQESQAIDVQEGENTVKVYPYVDVTVAAGEVVVRYTAGMNFYAFAFKANEPEPEVIWTVAGSKSVFGSEWSASDANNDMVKQEDGTYKWEKENITLAAGNVEFKVVKDHKWAEGYPEQNYQLAITEDGVYTISITFNAETKEITADATKTGEAEIDPTVSIAGSMNGWNVSADMMTLAEDKATASLTLNLAAQTYEFKVVLNGGDWRSNAHEFTRENATAAEMTGNLDNMHLVADVAGDYIFTWTFADNSLAITYPEAPVEGDTIVIDIEQAVQYTDYVAQAGWWQFMAENDVYSISISNISTTQAAGTYTIADLDADYTYIEIKATETEIHFVDGSFVLTEGEDGSRTIEGVMTGDDDNIYNIKLVYRIPTAETTVNVEIPEWSIYDGSEYYGIASYVFAGEAADGTYVQIVIPGTNPVGQFTYDDVYARGTGIEVAGDYQGIYSMNITINVSDAGRAIITADILCFNNTLYHVTTIVGEGVDNIDAAVKAIKRLVNGQLVIEKAGKTYNMNGAVIR